MGVLRPRLQLDSRRLLPAHVRKDSCSSRRVPDGDMSAGARSQKGASINGPVGDCIVARRFMLHSMTGLAGQRSDRAHLMRLVRRMRATQFALPNAVLMIHFSGCSVLLVTFIPKRNQTITWPWSASQQQQVPGCYSIQTFTQISRRSCCSKCALELCPREYGKCTKYSSRCTLANVARRNGVRCTLGP